ncbi:response regulator [Arcobacter sp. YIC-310]|uniref:response regulator n=1 Tax=Arcobacter sp. YIC-310 TaxID=3376632 RepID=UPI003C22D69C
MDKKLLKKLKILYVEDDTLVRNELQELLSDFFQKVFVAKDGQEGLEIYFDYKNEIDVVLTDINMPSLNGIDMLKRIREDSKKIPVFITTAYSDNDLLAKAIKLKVYEYLVKPIDVRYLLNQMNELANILYQESLIHKQNKELEEYKRVIDASSIVVKCDEYMKISYVNDLFCQTTSYDNTELLGQDFKILKHPDVSNEIYTNIYNQVLNGNAWHGVLKNLTKEHKTFTTDCYIIPVKNDLSEITGAISIQRDITEELDKKRNIQLSLMKDKSEIFIRSKEGSAEQNMIINNLKKELSILKRELDKSKKDIEKYIYSLEKYSLHNKHLRTELAGYKKQASEHTSMLKIMNENSQLEYKVKKLNKKCDELIDKYEKQFQQLKMDYQLEIDDLEEKLTDITQKYEAIETDDALIEKLEYWKQKAQTEMLRIENLEKQIIAYGDKEFMKKVFK